MFNNETIAGQTRRKADVRGWVQTSIAIIGITAAFFAWYTNQSSRANAQEVVNEVVVKLEEAQENHDIRGSSHYTYRDGIRIQLQEQREAIIKVEASIVRLDDKITSNGKTIVENRKDIKEILRIIRSQQNLTVTEAAE